MYVYIYLSLSPIDPYLYTPVSLRSGNVILFHKPCKDGGVDIGLVLTVWKGVKNPRQSTGEVAIASCSAYRVIVLDQKSQDNCGSWTPQDIQRMLGWDGFGLSWFILIHCLCVCVCVCVCLCFVFVFLNDFDSCGQSVPRSFNHLHFSIFSYPSNSVQPICHFKLLFSRTVTPSLFATVSLKHGLLAWRVWWQFLMWNRVSWFQDASGVRHLFLYKMHGCSGCTGAHSFCR